MVDFKTVTKATFTTVVNVIALLLFVGLVLHDGTAPKTPKAKIEAAHKEKIKLHLPKAPVKVSSTEMPPLPQKIVQLKSESISKSKMSVMKREKTQQKNVYFPPPLKAARNRNDKVEVTKPLVALQPIAGYRSSVAPSRKLTPIVNQRAPKKVNFEQQKSKNVSKPPIKKPAPEVKKLERRLIITAADISQGMNILREAEKGKTLNFELFWPHDRGQSERLYNLLSSCYGMESALLDNQGNLYFPAKKKGRLPSGFSPLLHQVGQAAAYGEAQKLNALRERHSLELSATSLRVHRRTTHAALLSGLERLSDKPISEFNSISARYEISGGELAISDIKFNNVPKSGRVALGGSSCG